MRIILLSAIATLSIFPAYAEPVPLLCWGDITVYGHEKASLAETGAALDLEGGTFLAPVYGTFRIIRVDDASISFGGETPTVSTFGTLDRVSGALSMNLMPPAERKKLQNGQTVHFTAYVDAKCMRSKKKF